jgi:DivIVA domain-containing protein
VGDHPRDDEPRAAGSGIHLVDVRDPLPEDLRDPSFASSVRGYDRHAVDAYVQRINRVIAELQVSGSPAAAVRQALDRVGEQTSGILRRARETAEEITRTAGEEAEETTARAKAQAEEIVAGARSEADAIGARASEEAEAARAAARADADARTRQADQEIAARRAQAEAQLRSLESDIAAAVQERRSVLDAMRGLAERLEAAVGEPEHAEPEAADEAVNGARAPAA